MDNTIRSILDELYQIEPTLQSKETEIVSLIEKMIQDRPKIQINQIFKNELRDEIIATFAHEEKKASWSFSWGQNFYSGLGAGFALFLISFMGYSFMHESASIIPQDVVTVQSDGLAISSSERKISFAPHIEKIPSEAFGTLTFDSNQSQSTGRETANMGGGMASPLAPTPEGATSKMMPASDSMMTMMPPMEMIRYNYIYTGSLDIPTGNLPVYSKNIVPFKGDELSGFLGGMNLDGFDIRALDNPQISSLTLLEDKQYGYIVSADFAGGTLSLYQNYEKWPQVKCTPSGCEEQKTLTVSDIPADDVVIDATNAFLVKYGIDMTLYGTPRIDHQIMHVMPIEGGAASTEPAYVPDAVSVTYPTLLEGKPVYEENGSPRGISLSYDVRNKRISNLYGMQKESLIASDYPVTTDRYALLKIVSQGGRYGGQGYDSGSGKVVDIILGEPELANMHIGSTSSDGKWQDYYVPALIFKVVSKPSDVYVSQTITVPLIDDFMKVESYQIMPYATPEMMVK